MINILKKIIAAKLIDCNPVISQHVLKTKFRSKHCKVKMTSCTVLGDAVIHDILMNLSKDEVITILGQIEESLKGSSVSSERAYQPDPAVINRADGRRNLFRPFTSPTGVGVKIIVDPSQALAKDTSLTDQAEKNRLMGLHGVIAICDHNGFPVGFLNAEEVTGYRTTLSAMILFVRRQNTAKIVVFGAGKQALWHIRLALALRGHEIEQIVVVNRSAERTKSLLATVTEENERYWKASAKLETVSPDNKAGLQRLLEQSDVVFCTTPSQQILFPASYLTGRKRGCYVSAIGSWQPNMIELDPELLTHAVSRQDPSGVVIVDNREECLKAAGEIIQSGLSDDKLAEVGEVLDLLAADPSDLQQQTSQCVRTGFVVYKSVGVSLTDLSAGQAILEMAKKMGKGVNVPDF